MLYSLLILGTFFWAGCDEDVAIPNEVVTSDTTYLDAIQSPQQKVVLLEEYTGVYCYTCPATHLVTAGILAAYPNKVIATNTHSTSFGIYTNPLVMGNLYDFRTVDGDSVVNMLGSVISLPSAAIDRKIHSGETRIISENRDFWQSYVAQQLSGDVKVNIRLDADFTFETRNLQVIVTLNYVEDVNIANYLSILLAENNIVDKQLMADLTVNDLYSHEHIVRDYMTDFYGEKITVSKEAGRVYVRVFNYTVPEEWDEDNLDVVVFVHEQGASKEIFQAASGKVK